MRLIRLLSGMYAAVEDWVVGPRPHKVVGPRPHKVTARPRTKVLCRPCYTAIQTAVLSGRTRPLFSCKLDYISIEFATKFATGNLEHECVGHRCLGNCVCLCGQKDANAAGVTDIRICKLPYQDHPFVHGVQDGRDVWLTTDGQWTDSDGHPDTGIPLEEREKWNFLNERSC